MDHLNSAADIKQILGRIRAEGDAERADLIEDTLRRVLTLPSGLIGTVPRSKGYVGIYDPAHRRRMRFAYVNFTGRVDVELPRAEIAKYERSGYVAWLDHLKEDHHRAVVELTDAVSVLVAVELVARARSFTEDGSRIRSPVSVV